MLELEKTGARVLTFTANVNHVEQMRTIRDQVKKQFGGIQGIFHAAGSVGADAFRTLGEVKTSDCEAQFEAKVYGVKVLYEVFGKEPLDFCVLQSSLSTVLGGLGLAAYSAANRFMDAFVQRLWQMDGPRGWMVVDWDGWQFEEAVGASGGVGEELLELAMTPEEGVEALKRILNEPGISRWVVSTADLESRLEKWVKGVPQDTAVETEKAEEPSGKYARPHLPTPYVAPRTDLEKKIAAVWEQLLGIEGIGIHDNFFDLGGNSLSGTQLVAKLRQVFQVELPLRELFEDPTIAAVAGIIEKQSTQQEEKTDKIKDLFSRVEQMSEEDIQSMLEQQKKQNSGN